MREEDELFLKAVEELGFMTEPLLTLYQRNDNSWPEEFQTTQSISYDNDTVTFRLDCMASGENHDPDIKGFLAAFSQTGQEEGLSHYFNLQAPMKDASTREAYNLLRGRYVMRFEEVTPDNFVPFWQHLERRPDIDGFNEKKIPLDFDLRHAIRKLPIKEMQHEQTALPLISKLLGGDMPEAHLDIQGREVKVRLAIDAEKKEIKIYDFIAKIPLTIEDLKRQIDQRLQKHSHWPVLRYPNGKGKGKGIG